MSPVIGRHYPVFAYIWFHVVVQENVGGLEISMGDAMTHDLEIVVHEG